VFPVTSGYHCNLPSAKRCSGILKDYFIAPVHRKYRSYGTRGAGLGRWGYIDCVPTERDFYVMNFQGLK
jgi:hypothetical protein